MVKGIDKFKEYFAGFENQYVIIGGTACDIQLEEGGAQFRATHDIDMVLIIEVLTKDFGEKFWSFIKAGGYSHINKGTGDFQFYRFSKPESDNYPLMIELFTRKEENIILKKNTGLEPIHIDDDISSLSAILLNTDYYSILKHGIEFIDGLSVLGLSYLVIFKMKAWLDLSERKEKGEKIDSKNIKKHINDVFRISLLIKEQKKISLPDTVKKDIVNFMAAAKDEVIDLKAIGIRTSKDEILNLYKRIFEI